MEEEDITTNHGVLPLAEDEIIKLEKMFERMSDEEDIYGGSITPRTIGEKSELDISDLQTEIFPEYEEEISTKIKDIDDEISSLKTQIESEPNLERKNLLIDKISLKTLEKLKIERLLSDFKEKKEQIKDKLFTIDYEEDAYLKISDHSKPKVTRYGIDARKCFEFVGKEFNNILHYLEYISFKITERQITNKKSLADNLRSGAAAGSAATHEYLQNVALFDVFVRDKGVIKGQDGKAETHTLALWRDNYTKQTHLIDPSNSQFTKYLENLLDLKIYEPKNEEGKVVEFYKIDKTLPEFSPYDDPSGNYRDCIDIAVKIAFEILEIQKELTHKQRVEEKLVEKIMERVRQQLSNQTELYNSKLYKQFTNFKMDTKLRVLQTSNFELRRSSHEDFHALEELIKLNFVDHSQITNITQAKEIWDSIKILVERKLLKSKK